MTANDSVLKAPRMLMIGAAGRDAGKTYFACSLLRRFAAQHDIVAAKVTPIAQITRTCPHGRSDCNVCASLTGTFEIGEETDPLPAKDTCKMLAAGAKRVFWLRALRAHLHEAAAALLGAMPAAAPTICESNSLRTVVEPGVFLMLKNSGSREPKPSSLDVLDHADRLILFDGRQFDIDFDDIGLAGGRWTIKLDATAILLAGGQSRRMGRDKAALPIGSKPMIQHVYDQIRPWFKQVLVGSNDPEKHAIPGATVVRDRQAGHGPMMAVASAMEAAAYDRCFVIACDIPHVDIGLMLRLLRGGRNADGAVPRIAPGQYEPLFAVYRKTMKSVIDELLAAGERKIDRSYDLCKMAFVDIAGGRLMNINTMQDYRALADEDGRSG